MALHDYRLMLTDSESLLRCPWSDEYEVRLRIPSEVVERARLGDGDALVRTLDERVADALRTLRYAHRKVPRLGAGTHGYRGRR